MEDVVGITRLCGPVVDGLFLANVRDYGREQGASATDCQCSRLAQRAWTMPQERGRCWRWRSETCGLRRLHLAAKQGLMLEIAVVDKLRAYMKGNLGFIFATKGILDEIQDVLAENRRWPGAKAGQISNVDLVFPSGPIGVDPSQTSFFRLLSIGIKIFKDQIELTSDFPLLKVGNKVSSCVQALLQKLGLKSFNFGMIVQGVFQDGGSVRCSRSRHQI